MRARLLGAVSWWSVAGGVVLGGVVVGVAMAIIGASGQSGSLQARPDAPVVPSARAVAPTATPATDAGEEESEPPSDPTETANASDEGGDDGSPSVGPASGGIEEAPPLWDAPAAGQGPLPDSSLVVCPASTTQVSTAEELEDALDSAAPGDVIGLADGTYEGHFEITKSGTAEHPSFLCGSAKAVLDGGDVDDGYTLHLDGADSWRLVGFTVSGGQKGVVADGTVGTVIQGLTVSGTGDEAVHLRTHSTDNVVLANTISRTGLRNEKYGEGVYIGSAVSNWCTYTACGADRSDRNVVKDNVISATSAESVDIKEGTTGGLVVGNTFDGSEMTGADSWVDVKGNNYLVVGNSGVSAPENGMQVHQILRGWGDRNVFESNVLDLDTPDWAITAWPEESNVVRCDNTSTGAAKGLSNVPCT